MARETLTSKFVCYVFRPLKATISYISKSAAQERIEKLKLGLVVEWVVGRNFVIMTQTTIL